MSCSKQSKSSLFKLSSADFAEIKKTTTFVDKTLFIKVVFNDSSRIVQLTAPKAFGKSTLMDMHKQFLLGRKDLFENLKISIEEKVFFEEHCKPHPVIHITLKDVSGKSFDEVKDSLALAISETFQEHGYLVKKTNDGTLSWASKKLNLSHIEAEDFEQFYRKKKCKKLGLADLKQSLKFLCEVLKTHYEENVFILIDEYDAPAIGLVFQAHKKKDDVEDIHEFLKGFMSSTLKDNKFIERALIFACVRLAGAFSPDPGRVIEYYPFLSNARYAPFLGFTDTEVQELLQRPLVKNKFEEGSFDTIKEWYDGYKAPKSELTIFSSLSIIKLIKSALETDTPIYSSFWIDVGHVKNMGELFINPSIREKIEKIISSEEVVIDKITVVSVENLQTLKKIIFLELDEISEKRVNLFLQFLADCGYFNMLPVTTNKVILKIPNFEIRQHIENNFYSEELNFVKDYKLNRENIKKYLATLQLVLESTTEGAFVDLANAVLALFSEPSESIKNESELHHILYTLAYDCRYFLTRSELQVKKTSPAPGRAPTLDVVITYKKIGIIFEYKMNSKSAEDALEQIFEKFYFTKFNEDEYTHISKKIYAGLAFNTKEKKVYIAFKVGRIDGEHISVCSN